MDAANNGGRVGAEVKIDLSRAQPLEHTVVAQGHGFDLQRAGQGSKDHFGGGGYFPGRISPSCAGLQMGRGGLPPQVVDNHFIAPAQAVVSHTAAHSSQSDKPDFHQSLQILPPVCCVSVSAAGNAEPLFLFFQSLQKIPDGR